MKLLEYESKRLFANAGIPVPKGTLVASADELAKIDVKFPVAVKSQVLTGGRMKAGGIGFAENADELRQTVDKLIGMDIRGSKVERVLVEPKADVTEEHYLGITYNTSAKAPVAIYSRAGGINVEQGGKASTALLSVIPATSDYLFKELLASAGLKGKLLTRITNVMSRLAALFTANDCTLAEINPLAVTSSGDVIALDAHIDLDDDALFRHRDLVAEWDLAHRETGKRVLSEFEQKAAELDAKDHRGIAGRMVAFDGNLGLLIGGGGGSLTAFDAVKRHGGTPANYCEMGGNPSVWKVKEVTKLLMGKPGVEKVAVIMSVVSNTRVDLVARGVIAGMLELGLNPAERIGIFRIPGAWEDDGYAILRKYGVPYVDRTVSIDEAARRAVHGEEG
jgi:succinyl-CoA synthetase beta subunit